MNRNIGVVLIVMGAIILIWSAFIYTNKQKLLEVGPVKVSVSRSEAANWPPYLGGLLLIGGIVVLVTSRKN